jgi:phage terminase large subunit GpA-like protein
MSNETIVTARWSIMFLAYANSFEGSYEEVDSVKRWSYRCKECGESASMKWEVKHGECGNDPCPLIEVQNILWPKKDEK